MPGEEAVGAERAREPGAGDLGEADERIARIGHRRAPAGEDKRPLGAGEIVDDRPDRVLVGREVGRQRMRGLAGQLEDLLGPAVGEAQDLRPAGAARGADRGREHRLELRRRGDGVVAGPDDRG